MQDRQTFLSSLPPLLCKQQEVILDWQLSISQACSSLVSQYNVPIVYLRTYHAKRPPLHQVLPAAFAAAVLGRANQVPTKHSGSAPRLTRHRAVGRPKL